MSNAIKSTPLKGEHLKLNAKMVPFAGWEMPVEYSGLRAEHNNVRENVGLFDVSHMGELRFKGEGALPTLQWLTSNDVSKLQAGQAQYSLLPNNQGGLVDDIIVYCIQPQKDYLVCVNAANKDKDLDWVLKNNRGADITDESDLWGQIAVQGPKAMALVEKVFGSENCQIGSFEFASLIYKSEKVYVARTGYTGEDGVEIFVPQNQLVALWQELLSNGQEFSVLPIGLGARDTLRTEMKYSLYGHEIDDHSNPYEAGLGWVVKPQAKDFIGKEKILEEKERGLKRKLVGFKMLDKAIPRAGYRLFSFDNKEIGKVTSGTLSPSLNYSIGIAYVDKDLSDVGKEFFVEIRQKMFKAEVVSTPFIKKS